MAVKKYITLGLLALGLSACDSASNLNSIPGSGKTETKNVEYQCDNNQTVSVHYVHNDTNSVAVVNLPDRKDLMMINVVAASGNKFAGTVYEWWSKGDTAMLTNIIENKTMQCHEKK